MADQEKTETTVQNHVQIAAILVASVAVVGYFAGSSPPDPPAANTASAETTELAAESLAPTYSILGERSGPNRSEGPGATERALSQAFADVKTRQPRANEATDAEVAQALAARSSYRAFPGAPPVIPHPVPERGALPCVSCHQSGLMVGSHRVAMMSHEFLTNCTQCHVSSSPGFTATSDMELSAGNSFRPVAQSRGSRAYIGAPPTVPHRLHMREECVACHDALGSNHGISTSHPERVSCSQCHAQESSRIPGFPLPVGLESSPRGSQ